MSNDLIFRYLSRKGSFKIVDNGKVAATFFGETILDKREVRIIDRTFCCLCGTSESYYTPHSPILEKLEKGFFLQPNSCSRDVSLVRKESRRSRRATYNSGEAQYLRTNYDYIREIVMNNLSFPASARKRRLSGRIRGIIYCGKDGRVDEFTLIQARGMRYLI